MYSISGMICATVCPVNTFKPVSSRYHELAVPGSVLPRAWPLTEGRDGSVGLQRLTSVVVENCSKILDVSSTRKIDFDLSSTTDPCSTYLVISFDLPSKIGVRFT